MMIHMLYRLNEKDTKRLKAARKKAGMTQVELAEKLNCTQSYVSMVESGIEGLTGETFRHWCEILNLKPVVIEPQARIG